MSRGPTLKRLRRNQILIPCWCLCARVFVLINSTTVFLVSEKAFYAWRSKGLVLFRRCVFYI